MSWSSAAVPEARPSRRSSRKRAGRWCCSKRSTTRAFTSANRCCRSICRCSGAWACSIRWTKSGWSSPVPNSTTKATSRPSIISPTPWTSPTPRLTRCGAPSSTTCCSGTAPPKARTCARESRSPKSNSGEARPRWCMPSMSTATRFVVDASGRETFLANRFNIKSRNPVHSSSAVFGHFKGAVRRPGRDEGNISVYWFDHGWYWMIPLRDGAMSVGAVCWTYYMKSRKVSVDQFLLDTIALCPMMAERLKDAKLMAPALATGNFSYRATRMTGDGYLMVGDAYAFIDPVFSSGVFLAMNSGELGAEVVDEALRNGDVSARSLRRYERTVKHGLKTFSWFIYRITTPALREMFMSPTHSFRLEEAILSLLSADIFGKTPIRGPLLVFKVIYYAVSIKNWRESLAAWLKRKRAWRTTLDFVWKSGN